MQFTRRVRRIDINPPEEYCSIASACYYTGMSLKLLIKSVHRGKAIAKKDAKLF